MSKGGKPFNMPEDQKAKERPTPSKEPSVDETLKDYHHRAMESVKLMVKKQMLASHAAANEVVARREAKSQLLALHLGCLPEKWDEKTAGTKESIMWAQTLGFNKAVDLMEQKLREMYGKT